MTCAGLGQSREDAQGSKAPRGSDQGVGALWALLWAFGAEAKESPDAVRMQLS